MDIARRSLKTKMALAVSALFVLFVACMAVLTFSYFKGEFKRNLSEQQFALVASLAHTIDQKLDLAKKSLVVAAAQVSVADVADADSLQRFMDSKPEMLTTFDNGLFVFSMDGKLAAESPFLPDRRGRDISFREYFKTTVATARPHISKPYMSTHSPGHPAVMVTAPIVDPQGRMIAFLGGSIDLLGKNLLEELLHIKVGETGHLYLFAEDRTLIIHPDKSRIMKRDVPVGMNKYFDLAIEGFEGTEETVNSRGKRFLASFAHLQATDWILSANYPVSEAYAPLSKARAYIGAAAVAGTAAVLAVAWLLMHGLTAPLLTIARHVSALPELSGEQKLIRISSQDEIGTLAEAFNQMVSTLDRQQAALQESEINFRALADNANDGMLIIDELGDCVYANRRVAEISGYPLEHLPGSPVSELFCAGARQELLETCQRILAGHASLKPQELSIAHHSGVDVVVEVTSGPTLWKGAPAVLLVMRDITLRKQAESEIQQLAYYDPLTSLPNRALLRDRLSQALVLADREQKHVGVMFLDLDRFKGVNDTLGHVAGDRLLGVVAGRLKACLRECDTVARLGGDEFVIVVTGIGQGRHPSALAEKILAMLAEPVLFEGQEIYTTGSIGIALYPADGGDVNELLKHADMAMYKAKEAGRNNFQFFSREMNAWALD
ncbi:bifunctional diguanylate cyclase/phosphodiesterase [Trichloromonas sp.]|uniref:bifunctional diguanylate cyclase/phosphodiesterase n=1 Tax=Trichloromonas sp. TaxID=3069249 RepID=UPI003D818DC3